MRVEMRPVCARLTMAARLQCEKVRVP